MEGGRLEGSIEALKVRILVMVDTRDALGGEL